MNIDALCEDPGPDGAFWRLTRVLNPPAIGAWLEHERARGTPSDIQARALGQVCALLAHSFEQSTGSTGIKAEFEKALKKYETQGRTGLIVPNAA